MTATAVIVVAIAALGIAAALRSPSAPPMPIALRSTVLIVAVSASEFRKAGSAPLEVLLWLFFLVPGIIYSIWRSSTRRWVCPMCEQEGMIPLTSPLAHKALSATPRGDSERRNTGAVEPMSD